ncbi:unnamed protein product [Knipowitschia caucasica]
MADFDRFLSHPTEEELNKFKKTELVDIADLCQIEVDKNLKKAELKHIVASWLVEHGGMHVPRLEVEVVAGHSERPEATSLVLGPEVCPSTARVPPKAEERLTTSSSPPGVSESRGRPDHPTRFSWDHSLGSPSRFPQVPTRHRVPVERLGEEAEERERERQATMELQYRLKKLEIEAETALKMRRLELEAEGRLPLNPSRVVAAVEPAHSPVQPVDVSKYVSLFPNFRESEIYSYFSAFERIAQAINCPPELWSTLLQCKLTGKAQEVSAALSLEESMRYESVKVAILRSYQLVPEAYRQRFRGLQKAPNQTYVEFAREKHTLFEKWCTSSQVNSFCDLRELILLEEFKDNLAERVVMYLSEQKVTTLQEAAVLADEFALTHRTTFGTEKNRSFVSEPIRRSANTPPVHKEQRECFYCHKPGHVISNCLALKRKSNYSATKANGVGVINMESTPVVSDSADPCFKPFILEGLVSVKGALHDQKSIRILRDTGGAQSVILASALPFSSESFCGYNAVLRGIEMGYCPHPVHYVHIEIQTCYRCFPYCCVPGVAHSRCAYADGK